MTSDPVTAATAGTVTVTMRNADLAGIRLGSARIRSASGAGRAPG